MPFLSKIIAGLAALLLTACALNSSDARVPLRILCFGDTITRGGHWVGTVGKDPRFETINAGLNGRRAAWAVKHLGPILDEHSEIDAVILFLGVNDLPARDPRPGDEKVASCVENMSAAIDLAKTRVAARDIILVAPPTVNPEKMNSTNLKKGYDAALPLLQLLEKEYEALAARKGTRFLSLHGVVDQAFLHDGLHPNREGGAQIAAAVLEFLSRDLAPPLGGEK